MQNLIKDLNRAYRDLPALHQRDCEPEGFSWLVVTDSENSVFAWARYAPDQKPVAVISNFHTGPARGLSGSPASGRTLA